MKILRLSPPDARTWRENRAVLIDQNGDHVRPIELHETRILSELQKKARMTRQPMEHHHKIQTPQGEVTSHLVVSFKDIGPRNTVIVSTIDGHEVMEGREFFTRQVLKVHGECQLRDHTGRFMKAIRDPNVRRPTAKDAQRQAPRPEHCMCRGWGHSHPGRHHSLCEWNLKAPYDEQALPNEATTTMVDQRLLPDSRPAEKPSILQQKPRPNANAAEVSAQVSANIATAVAQQVIPSPDICVCKEFAMPNTGDKRPDGIHHPLCQHKDAWEASQLPKMFLMNLSTGQVFRQATADEIKEAHSDKGYVTIGSDQFGVMPEHEVTGAKKPEASSTAAAE